MTLQVASVVAGAPIEAACRSARALQHMTTWSARGGIIAIVMVLTACGGGRATPTELLVGAASDLAAAMPALTAGFEAEHGVRATVTLGSSGQIAQQILQGAPVDVFLSADRTWVDRVADAGLVAPDGRALYARGLLALVTSRGRSPIMSVARLERADVRRIAIANPAHAPYGRAARQALERVGVYGAVADRLIYAENVRQTLQFVSTGNVDAAIAARSLMDSSSPPWVVVPEALHEPLLQEAAVIAGRSHEAAARAFLAYLTSAQGQEILARHGFLLPERAP